MFERTLNNRLYKLSRQRNPPFYLAEVSTGPPVLAKNKSLEKQVAGLSLSVSVFAIDGNPGIVQCVVLAKQMGLSLSV